MKMWSCGKFSRFSSSAPLRLSRKILQYWTDKAEFSQKILWVLIFFRARSVSMKSHNWLFILSLWLCVESDLACANLGFPKHMKSCMKFLWCLIESLWVDAFRWSHQNVIVMVVQNRNCLRKARLAIVLNSYFVDTRSPFESVSLKFWIWQLLNVMEHNDLAHWAAFAFNQRGILHLTCKLHSSEASCKHQQWTHRLAAQMKFTIISCNSTNLTFHSF